MRVGLAIPLGGRATSWDADAYSRGIAVKASETIPLDVGGFGSSLLPFTFNVLWCGFLNMRSQGITHFAMIHDDICPDKGWLDVLMEELNRHDADVISAVVPIKDDRGLTSTALDTTGDEWNPRRLTMHEVYADYPETFTHEKILLNTGLWLARLDRPWIEEVGFRQTDRVVKGPDGNMYPQTQPEDWDFSRQARRFGAKLYATRAVGLNHERAEWHNRHPWGKWQVDQDQPGLKPVLTAPMGERVA